MLFCIFQKFIDISQSPRNFVSQIQPCKWLKSSSPSLKESYMHSHNLALQVPTQHWNSGRYRDCIGLLYRDFEKMKYWDEYHFVKNFYKQIQSQYDFGIVPTNCRYRYHIGTRNLLGASCRNFTGTVLGRHYWDFMSWGYRDWSLITPWDQIKSHYRPCDVPMRTVCHPEMRPINFQSRQGIDIGI